MIDLHAHNFVHVKTSLRAHCVHAHHCARNLLSPGIFGKSNEIVTKSFLHLFVTKGLQECRYHKNGTKKNLKNGTTTVTIIHYSLFIEPIKCILTRCSHMGEMLNVNRPWPGQIVHPAFGPWLLLGNSNGKLFLL